MAENNENYSIASMLEAMGQDYVPSRYLDSKDMEYRFWFRTLYTDLCSVFEFEGVRPEWPMNFFKLCLFLRGHIAIFPTKEYGLTFQPCNLRDLNWYFQPKYACVSNAYYKEGNSFYHEYEIGKECALIKIADDYLGIVDHVDYFCQKLANLSVAINMACATAKIPAVFQVNDERDKKAVQMVIDDSQSGKPFVLTANKNDGSNIVPSKDMVSAVFAELKRNYIGTELLADLQTVLDMWYSFIGFPTTVDKNSHILNEEADFQFAQSFAKVTTWLYNMNRDFEVANKLFGTEMEVHHVSETLINRTGTESESSSEESSGQDDSE